MTRTVLTYESPPVPAPAAAGRYALLAFLCAAAAIAYVQRSEIAVAAGSIQGDLSVDKVQLGAVMAAWSLGYAAGQIPSGWLADRWGSRRALTLFALAWSAATGLIAAAAGYFSLLALWTLMGVAQAGVFPCCTRAISRAFATERRAAATGLLASSMGVGGAIAPVLTGALLTALSWRWVFVLYAVPGLAWAALFYARRREWSDVAGPLPLTLLPPASAVAPAWRRMAGSYPMWLLCAQQFLRAAAMMFFLTWFPTFLRETRGVSILESGLLTTMVGAGAVLGPLAGGFASDKVLAVTGSARLGRQGVAVAGMLACAALIVCAYFIADTTLAVGVISAGAFCGTFGGVIGYTVAMDFGGRRVATVFSVMNTCGNVGAAIFPLTIGWLRERTGNWDLVLFIFAGIFVADAACWALLNPKRPLFEEA